MSDEYKGAMPDSWFRSLSAREEEQFRQCAHDTWSQVKPENFALFHPVVRDEWRKIDAWRLNQIDRKEA